MAFVDDDKMATQIVSLANSDNGIRATSAVVVTWCDMATAVGSKMLVFRSVSEPFLRTAAGKPSSWKSSVTALVQSSCDDDKDGSKASAVAAAVITFIGGISYSSLGSAISATVHHISPSDLNSNVTEGYHVREIVFDVHYV